VDTRAISNHFQALVTSCGGGDRGHKRLTQYRMYRGPLVTIVLKDCSHQSPSKELGPEIVGRVTSVYLENVIAAVVGIKRSLPGEPISKTWVVLDIVQKPTPKPIHRFVGC
jgi:hypothetical protein